MTQSSHSQVDRGIQQIPTVEQRVSESTEIWAKELRSLFDRAKDRFGDVSWESEETREYVANDRIWGHKGMYCTPFVD
jgi:hypothetical protein